MTGSASILNGPWGRAIIGAALCILAFVSVFSAQRDQGVVRDEVIYMRYAERYVEWWGKMLSGTDGMVSEQVITDYFGGDKPFANNREHPPLMKTLMGTSHWLLHQKLGWTDELSAFRVPSAGMNALLIGLVFLLCAGLWGTLVGVVAALCTLFLPRAFFHAGLGCFDAAMVTMWMATIVAYYRAITWRGSWLTVGVVFGLALATKHNALMLPGALGTHYLYLAVRSQWHTGLREPGAASKLKALWRGVLGIRPAIIPSMALIGPLVLVAMWPWLWFDTIDHIGDWLAFHLDHVHYNYEYLGENWNRPPFPWHVPIVTTLFTVPVVVSLAAVCGAGAHIRTLLDRRARATSDGPDESRPGSADTSTDDAAVIALLVLSMLVAWGPFLTGRAPIFGAEKHWAPAIPTLCILAALGVKSAAELAVDRLWRLERLHRRSRLWRVRVELAATVLIASAVVGASASETVAAQPYALSHYNALAGGAPGGAELGMNRHFWGYAARGLLPYLNERARAGSGPMPVYSHDADPTWGWYRRLGMVDERLVGAGRGRAGVEYSAFAMVIHELHFSRHEYLIWDVYGTLQPVHVLRFQGVPIVTLYARDGLVKTP